MNIAFAEPDAELGEISEAANALLTRLGGLDIARGLLDGDDTAARAADSALLEFGALDLAACEDPARPAPLRHLAAVAGALGAQTLAARYVPGLAHAHLASALGDSAPADWAGSVAFWDAPSPDAAWAGAPRKLAVRASGDRARVAGVVAAVAGDLALGSVYVPARSDDEDLLLQVEAGADGVEIRDRPSLNPALQLSDLVLDADCRIAARGERARTALRSAHRLALCVVATASAHGAIATARLATIYARDRFQFGQPIGAFQAIKHRCADMYIEGELARAIAEGAAADPASPDGPHAAKAFCAEAYRFVAAHALQAHGGVGITWEHPAHLFLRDANALAALLGGAESHRRLIGEAARAAAETNAMAQ